METNEIIENINLILIKVLKHDNFVLEDKLTAADVDGWDSLSHMMIISEIENKFAIKFRLKELNKMNNFGDLIELVTSKIKQE